MWSIQLLSCLCSKRVGVVEASMQWAEIKAGHCCCIGLSTWLELICTDINSCAVLQIWVKPSAMPSSPFLFKPVGFLFVFVLFISVLVYFFPLQLQVPFVCVPWPILFCRSQSFDLKTQIYSPYQASSQLTLDSECIWCLLCLIYSCVIFYLTASSTTPFQQPSQFHRPRPGKTNKSSTYRGPQWIS